MQLAVGERQHHIIRLDGDLARPMRPYHLAEDRDRRTDLITETLDNTRAESGASAPRQTVHNQHSRNRIYIASQTR